MSASLERRVEERAQGKIPVKYPRPATSETEDLDGQSVKKRKLGDDRQTKLPKSLPEWFTFDKSYLDIVSQKNKQQFIDPKLHGEIRRRYFRGELMILIKEYTDTRGSLDPKVRKLYNDIAELEKRVVCDRNLTKDELEKKYNDFVQSYHEIKPILSPRGDKYLVPCLKSLAKSIETFD